MSVLLVHPAHAFGTSSSTAEPPVPQTFSFTDNGTNTLGNGVSCSIRSQIADILSTSGSSNNTFVRFYGPSNQFLGAVAGGYYYSPDLSGGAWQGPFGSLATNMSAIETACGWTPGSMSVINETRTGTSFSTATEITTTFRFAYGGGLYQYSGGIVAASASAIASPTNSLTYVGPYSPSVAPSQPTTAAATAGNAQASVTFAEPSSDGGAAITNYNATCTSSNGGNTGTASASASPITVTGLTNGKNYTCTVTATNSAGTGAASSASNAVTPMGTQTINFANPGSQNFGTTPTLTATSTSGLTVAFTSSSTGVCTISTGGALSFLTIGNCTILADNAGDASYLPASTVTQSFAVNAVAPGAPTIDRTTAGIGQATVAFSAPISDGQAAITGYTVTCTSSNGGTAGTASGNSSPITVTGLTNGKNYACTVTATNSVGIGFASAASSAVAILSPIPSLSEWAMVLMALLMGLFAVIRLKARLPKLVTS